MRLRMFDAQPGREPELLKRLQGIGTGMIRQDLLDAVQICRYADSADRIVWIEDRRTAPRAGSVLEQEVAGTCAEILVQGPVSQSFELIDGFYRYPLPPCQVWSLELSPAIGHEQGGLTHFLDRARMASAEPSVAGLAIYRAQGSPRLLIFVALSEGVVPSEGSFLSPRLAGGKWRRLIVVWTMGRVLRDLDRRGHATAGFYPRPAFWARAMPVLAVAPIPEGSSSVSEAPQPIERKGPEKR